MYQGLVLFYVGAVLILNGLWMLGRIDDREISVINLFVGGLSLLVSLKLAFGYSVNPLTIKTAAFSLLFSLTYLWVAYNRFTRCDGRGIGWFSLFVSLNAVAISIDSFWQAHTPWQYWSALSWAAWALLWFLFYLSLVQGKPVERFTGRLAIFQGVVTGWLPGYLLLTGRINFS